MANKMDLELKTGVALEIKHFNIDFVQRTNEVNGHSFTWSEAVKKYDTMLVQPWAIQALYHVPKPTGKYTSADQLQQEYYVILVANQEFMLDDLATVAKLKELMSEKQDLS